MEKPFDSYAIKIIDHDNAINICDSEWEMEINMSELFNKNAQRLFDTF